MKDFKITQQTCSIFVVIVVVTSIFVFHKKLSLVIWDNFHSENVAVLLNQKDSKLFFDIGNYYFGNGGYDLKKSESYYKKALVLDDSLKSLHYQLARVYFIKGDLYKAKYEINKELELYPDFKRSYYVRGLINGYDNKLEEAAGDFVEFLKWRPESWAGYNDLAWIYFRMGDYENALAASEEGLKYFAGSVWLLNAKGVALLNLGKNDEAKIALTQALVISNGMSAEDWGKPYPGNNPAVYSTGLEAMRESIKRNLILAEKSGA